MAELGGKLDVRLALIPKKYGKDVNEAANAGWNPAVAKTRHVERRRMISFNIG
ncbi:hypothetical protein D3C76_1769730 [compost metagenome]